MLSALNTNVIDPKALKGAKGAAAQGETNLLDAMNTSGEAQGEFAAELMASLSGEDLKVQAVEVPADQALRMPSSLITLPESPEQEIINPKVFDPALTQGVEKLVQPLSSEVQTEVEVPVELSNADVLKIAKLNPELAGKAQMSDAQVAALAEAKPADILSQMKAAQLPQVQSQAVATGRSPAIEFAQSEIDPQLMNMEDFVAQKNSVAKKQLTTSAYGMQKPQMQKLEMESGLKSTEIVQDLGSVETVNSGTPSSVNSQQFLLNLSADQGSAPQVSDVSGTQKVFDMSQVKTDNPNQIMNQISDYIVQAKAAKEPTVNMRVNHEELGMIDITVHRTGNASSEAVAINIGTHTADGKNFFQSNSKELFSHLTQAGINVADLKVETPSQSQKNDFDMGNQQGRGGFGQDKQFASEQNQRRQDSERRQDLWNLLKDKEAA